MPHPSGLVLRTQLRLRARVPVSARLGVCVCVCVLRERIVTFADRTAEVRLSDGVGALERRTLLLTADHIASLTHTGCDKC